MPAVTGAPAGSAPANGSGAAAWLASSDLARRRDAAGGAGADQQAAAYRAGANPSAAGQGMAQQQDRGAVPPQVGPSHVGWQAAENWGTASITMSANTAAGFSYLFAWLSGTFFFFGERQNRYVRFHAMQSILLTVPFTVLAILVYVLVSIVLAKQLDVVATTLWLMVAALLALAMLGTWLWALAAAWNGHWLRLPIVGFWADYFSASPQDPYVQQPAE
jgi:uncharacterized membrane protein